MKIGILGCGYQCHEGLDERLNPWFELAKKYKFVFSFVSAQFQEYANMGDKYENKETIAKFDDLFWGNKIHCINAPQSPQTEAQARDLALQSLLEYDCDFIWLLDLSDEYYTEENIEKIITYITREDNSLFTWFSINFKNYILDGSKWVDGFCPPRIFRTQYGNFKLLQCYWDNDFIYSHRVGETETHRANYRDLSSKEIPRAVAHIKHLTWIDTPNIINKINYQKKHFNGICSYKINEDTGKLELNIEGYYNKLNIPIPIINSD